MRVTHVITRLIVGGAQENTVASVLGLRQKPGLDVQLISGLTSGPEGSLEPLFAHIPGTLSILPELVRPVRPWKDWRALQRLADQFRSYRPDIVHTHSGKGGVVGRLAAARAGVPIIIHTIHGPSFGSFQGALANLAFREAERYAGRVTTHFVTVADAMKEQYLGAHIGTPQQYTRILSGFTLEPFLAAVNDPGLRARFGLQSEHVVIGKIARLCPLKGHEDLLTVAPELTRRFPEVRFLLVGDGELRKHLEQRTQELGVAKYFVFTGLVRPAEVPGLLGIMDLLVHLSAREGIARALPQALAAGRPIVAYDCDGAKEVCLQNETGLLVAPGDLARLTGCLSQLVCEPSLRERLGQRGREFVRERFGVQTMVDELHRLYLRLAAQRGVGSAEPARSG
jgi:glycosyltransferase involved in cell wall biosynthesis